MVPEAPGADDGGVIGLPSASGGVSTDSGGNDGGAVAETVRSAKGSGRSSRAPRLFERCIAGVADGTAVDVLAAVRRST